MSGSVECKFHLNLFIGPNSSALSTFQLFDKNDHACFMLCDSSSGRKEEEEKKEGRLIFRGEKEDSQTFPHPHLRIDRVYETVLV